MSRLTTASTMGSLEGFCKACNLAMDEVLHLSVDDFQLLSRKVVKNGPLQHAFAYSNWIKERKRLGTVSVAPDAAPSSSPASNKHGAKCDDTSKTEARVPEAATSSSSILKGKTLDTPQDTAKVPEAATSSSSMKNKLQAKIAAMSKDAARERKPDPWSLHVKSASSKIWRLRQMLGDEGDLALAKQGKVAVSVHCFTTILDNHPTWLSSPLQREKFLPLAKRYKCDMGTYWNNIVQKFFQMKQGDVVCLVVRHDMRKPTNNKSVLFGILEDDLVETLALTNEDQTDARCLVTSSVKWFWKVPMRDLPDQTTNKQGTNYVKWLSECATCQFVEVTKKGAKEVLQSPRFLEVAKRYHKDNLVI